MKKYLAKATTITSVVAIGAMCLGAIPANSYSPPIIPVTANAESLNSSAISLTNREQITEIFNLVNEYRVANGQKALMFSVPASEESQKWSQRMAKEKRMYHNPNPGTDPRITAAPWDRWAENVAGRWDGDGAEMFQQWVDSPSHNVNLLSSKVNTIGIGMAITGNKDFQKDPSNYYMWGTQNFYNFTGKLPALTYASPDDYFEGRPSLDSQQSKEIVVKRPAVNYETANYTLHPIEGVEYYVNGVKKNPGTYFSNWSKVTIEYRALSGWKHTTSSKTYSVTIDFSQYLKNVKPIPPVFKFDTGKYIISETANVDYYVNNIKKPKGTYDSGWTTINIVAKPHAGYTITGVASWSHKFVKPPAPAIVATPKAPSFNKTNGTYTIPVTTGIVYRVNGVNTKAGTYNSGWKKITVTAIANSGYKLSGTSSWSYTFVKPAIVVKPKPPTFNKTTGKYIIPATSGIQYRVNGVNTKAGTYSSGWKKITVTAVAKTGYKITGASSWSYTFTKPAIVVKPKPPTFNKTTGKYIIPTTNGIQYRVNGVNAKAGTYNSGWKKITVTAVAKTGYKVSGIPSWSYTFAKPAITVKPKSPTFNKTTGKYIIPTVSGVQYRVNGVNTKAGTYNSGWKKITVTAVAKTGYKVSGTSSWSYVFLRPK